MTVRVAVTNLADNLDRVAEDRNLFHNAPGECPLPTTLLSQKSTYVSSELSAADVHLLSLRLLQLSPVSAP